MRVAGETTEIEELRRLIVKSVLVDALGLDRAVVTETDDGGRDEFFLTRGDNTVRVSAAGGRLYAEVVT